MPMKRHIAVWRILAIHLNVNQKSIATFDRLCIDPSFLHVVLPSLGKDLERGLLGRFELTTRAFKKQKRSELPQFLYELLIAVFDKEGYIRERPTGIKDLRQLCMMFYKFEVPETAIQLQRATQKYIETDKAVKTHSYPFGLEQVRRNFVSLLPDDPMDIRPHHANGATADGYNNVQKRTRRRHIPSLMKVYGPKYFFNSRQHANFWCRLYETITTEPPARLAFVPKDSRGPRSICMEPHEKMFIQKGLQTKLYEFIEDYSPAKGYINFTDQTINQRLAQEGSISQKYATIDLKDASDMVPWNLIRLLCTPDWFAALQATRSATVSVTDNYKINLNKFASMGSALCFPVEAMLFWSICRTVTDEVWVYGDDIIVANTAALDVIDALESYGLIVNVGKSLYTGFFRESCGGDYYKGEDIGYVKCTSYDDVDYIAFCNNITEAFDVNLAEKLLKIHENETGQPVMRHHISYCDTPEPFVFYSDRLSASAVFFSQRYNKDLQRSESRWLHASVEKVNGETTEYDKLFDWLTCANSHTAPDELTRLDRLTEGVFLNQEYAIKSSYESCSSILRSRNATSQVSRPAYKYVWDCADKQHMPV